MEFNLQQTLNIKQKRLNCAKETRLKAVHIHKHKYWKCVRLCPFLQYY